MHVDMVNSSISGIQSLKRVRFEKKAIERDYDSHQSSHVTSSDAPPGRERVTRKPHSLYRNNAESIALQNHPSSATMESGMDKFSHGGSSTMNRRHAVRVPQGFDTSFEDLQLKNHVTSTSLLPWSRVYRMTQSTEAVPSPHPPNVYGSYPLSDTNGRANLPSEKYSIVGAQHFVVSYVLSVLSNLSEHFPYSGF